MKNNGTLIERKPLRMTALAIAAAQCAMLCGSAAMAQTTDKADAKDGDVTTVVVTGQRKALATAQRLKQEAEQIVDSVVADETRSRMHAAVAQLTKTQREVFLLRVTEGLSYKDIAGVAGTTEGAARVHYHNAMRAIKEFLDE